MSEKIIKRGEIYWIHLPLTNKNNKETNGQLGVVVSSDEQNSISHFVTVVPFILESDKLCPFEVTVEFNQKNGKILTSQITTIEKKRLCEKMGELNKEVMNQIEQSLYLVLVSPNSSSNKK
jgi:mRNA-degrading endonuclease toxin of MazEF toxin-antitoxin module